MDKIECHKCLACGVCAHVLLAAPKVKNRRACKMVYAKSINIDEPVFGRGKQQGVGTKITEHVVRNKNYKPKEE